MLIIVRLAKLSELIEVAKIYLDMYAEHSLEEMYRWVISEEYPYRQHYVIEYRQHHIIERGKIVGAITWELYDNYQGRIVAKIKWLAIRGEFRGQGLGAKLIKESFYTFNASWQGKVETIRVAPYEEKALEEWYKKVLDTLPGPEIQIIKIPNLFGAGKGENVIIKNLR